MRKTSEIPQYLWNNIQRGIKLKKYDFDIDEEYIWNLFLQQKRKCNLTHRNLCFDKNSDKNTASLDRIDSNKGYIKGNVQWVHKDINIIKNRFNQNYFVEICSEIYEKNKHKIEIIDRPEWVDYFLGLAITISQRSIDSQTKVGAIITDEQNRIVATGYNSFPRDMPDSIFPNMRDEKYPYILHAEMSAMSSCSPNLSNSILKHNMYLTLKPCLECLKFILNTNISNIYAIDSLGSQKTNENSDVWEVMLMNSKVNLYLIKPKLEWMKQALLQY